MNPRYKISELATQDLRGVVFEGVDVESGDAVAMRRFLPTGAKSSGLDPRKQQVYQQAVANMKQVSHPALRDVLDGGCDAVDGMPYLVTEWTDGCTLREWIAENGRPGPDLVRIMLARMLDVCIALSKVFGREELWVEATLESVTMRDATARKSPPSVSFWVCPWRWFGEKQNDGWRMGVAEFAESLLGGPGRASADPEDAPLTVWIQRIRHGELTTLQSALNALKVPPASGTPPDAEDSPSAKAASPKSKAAGRPATPKPTPDVALPESTRGNVRVNNTPSTPTRCASRIAAGLLALAIIAGGAWWLIEKRAGDAGNPSATNSPAHRVPAAVDDTAMPVHPDASAIQQHRQSAEKRGFYTVNEADLLMERSGQEVTLRGRLARVRFSGSGLTMYLEFSEDPPLAQPRAYVMMRDLAAGIHEDDLLPLIGKLIEIRGPLDIENISRTRRPRVNLISRDHITVLADEEDYELR